MIASAKSIPVETPADVNINPTGCRSYSCPIGHRETGRMPCLFGPNDWWQVVRSIPRKRPATGIRNTQKLSDRLAVSCASPKPPFVKTCFQNAHLLLCHLVGKGRSLRRMTQACRLASAAVRMRCAPARRPMKHNVCGMRSGRGRAHG